MNLVNEGVLPPNEPDDRDERREEREMAQDREKLADLMAEYRKDLDEMVAHRQYAPTIRYVAKLLDRIEAAWKREKAEAEANALAVGGIVEASRQKPVGNAAAMREALCEIVLLILKVGRLIRADVACGIIASKAKHALSASPRQCDVYDPDKAAHMMEVEYCSQMPPSHCDGTNCTRCSFKWFTSPAEKGGSK